MKRFLLAAALALVPIAASATQISDPHIFTDGETLSAETLNPPFATLYAWANGNVDSSNIGPNGIYASQIKPGSISQATFGGAVGYVFSAASASIVPLTISAANLQSSDLLDVNNYAGTTLAKIDSLGNLTGASITLTGTGITSTYGAFSGNVSAPSFSATGAGSFGSVNTGTISSGGSLSLPEPVGIGGAVTVAGNVTAAAFIGTSVGVTQGITAQDIYAIRSPSTGALFLGSSGAHYLLFDGTNYNLPNGGLSVANGPIYAGGQVIAPLVQGNGTAVGAGARTYYASTSISGCSTGAAAGTLVCSVTLTYPAAFTTPGSYAFTCGGDTAVMCVALTKNAGSVVVGLYSIGNNATPASFYFDWLATGY